MAQSNLTATKEIIKVPHAKWAPVPMTVIQDEALAQRIHIDGYAVVDFLSETQLEQLRAIHHREHQLEIEGGGMFYSMYSQDFDYRKRVDAEIRTLLTPSFDQHFKDYRNIINLFVVKLSGPASEFAIHQDMTAVDETKYSPLSCWIPLWDIGPENGAMCVVPYSHWFFSPYRSISFPFPFSGIYHDIRPYLQPIYMKAGQALIFDPRILHNSLQNTSGKERVSIVAGIFPPEAEIITCYKDPSIENAPIELLREPDNFLLEYPNFFHNCHVKPDTGSNIGVAEFEMGPISAEQFRDLCAINGLEPVNLIPEPNGMQCKMVAEPDEHFDLPTPEPVLAQGGEKGIFGKMLNALGLGKN